MGLLDTMLARVGKTRADFDLRSRVGRALHADGVPDSPEVQRVLALPRREPEPDALELLSREYSTRPSSAPSSASPTACPSTARLCIASSPAVSRTGTRWRAWTSRSLPI